MQLLFAIGKASCGWRKADNSFRSLICFRFASAERSSDDEILRKDNSERYQIRDKLDYCFERSCSTRDRFESISRVRLEGSEIQRLN